jgi:hypothetical protein
MDIAITIFPVIVVACAETKYALRASVVAGICFHFIVAAPAVEFERSMRRFFSAAGIFSGGGLVISSFFADQSPTTGLTRLVVSWSGFAGGLLLSLTIYRLFFHRCRSFPGPLVARLTRFYASYLNAREEQFYKKLKIIHTEYGDYARVGEYSTLFLQRFNHLTRLHQAHVNSAFSTLLLSPSYTDPRLSVQSRRFTPPTVDTMTWFRSTEYEILSNTGREGVLGIEACQLKVSIRILYVGESINQPSFDAIPASD